MGRIVDENYEPVHCDALEDEHEYDIKDEEKNTIVNALRVIKQTCLSYQKICDIDGCTVCPLRSDEYGNCAIINHTPDNWKINESNEWRAIL